MKTPIVYYGGKQRMSKRIIDFMPNHLTYVEPYLGGGAVFFAKDPCKLEVINDLNLRIVNFFRVLRDENKARKLLVQFELTPWSRNEYEACRVPFDPTVDDVENARRLLFNSIACFGGNMNGGFRRPGKHETVSRYIPVKKNLEFNLKANLDVYIDRLSHCIIECKPALDVIRMYDSVDTCFYCDPPYVGAFQGHYRGFSQSDLDELIETLDNITGSFVLSGYDNPSYPKAWDRLEIPCKTSVNGSHAKRTEILLRKVARS